MKYPAAELKADAYIAYSKDAFNDENQGLAYFLQDGKRVKPTVGNKDRFGQMLHTPIDTLHYIETALPSIDKAFYILDDGSGKEIQMSLITWYVNVDCSILHYYSACDSPSPSECKVSVPAHLYEKWENYLRRSNSYKKKHPKPSVNDGILIENYGADYFFKTNFYPPRAYVEIVYKKYIHVHGEPKLEWLAVPECVPISNLELNDYMFYERESALNLAIEISAALADFHDLDTSYRNGDKTFYNIALFELKQRLLPDLLKSETIYLRIAIARTFIYALLNRLTDQMNSGWEDADTQAQYKKIEEWVAPIAMHLHKILLDPPPRSLDEPISAYYMRYPIQFCDPQQPPDIDKSYPKIRKTKESDAITPNSFALFCNPEHPNVAFYLDRIDAYSRDLLKAKETYSDNLKLPDISRCRDFKSEIFAEVYRAISAEMEKAKNS